MFFSEHELEKALRDAVWYELLSPRPISQKDCEISRNRGRNQNNCFLSTLLMLHVFNLVKFAYL